GDRRRGAAAQGWRSTVASTGQGCDRAPAAGRREAGLHGGRADGSPGGQDQDQDEPLLDEACDAPARLHAQKKKFVAVERDTPENLWRRQVVAALLSVASARKLVFLDESFCRTDMARERGWGLAGARVYGTRPGRSWKTLTLI